MSEPSESTPRQQQLIVTIFGLYCRGHGEAIAVADLIRLLGDCGVESSAVRSAVSRLKKRGLLVNRRVRGSTVYAPSEQMREVFREGDERIFHPPRSGAADAWLLAAFTVPEAKRHLRHKIRSIFTKWGSGSVTPGVWIAPDINAERIRGELELHRLSGYVDFFGAHYLGAEELRVKVAQWWDLPSLAGLYEQFLAQWRPALDDAAQTSDAEAFARYVTLMTQWRRLPYLDPGLPLELLPAPWPAERASALMQALHERWSAASAAHVALVTADRGPGE